MKFLYLILFILPCTGLFTNTYAAACEISSLHFTSLTDGARVSTLELPDDWESAPASSAAPVTDFKKNVISLTSTDPKYLINRQRNLAKSLPSIFERLTRVYNDKLGKIESAGCLETSVLSAILTEYPKNPEVEFGVYVLRNQENKYRAYVLTWGVDHVPPSKDLWRILERDLQQRWEYYIHLHNHPFFFNNPAGDIAGVVVPSEPDFAHYSEELKHKGLQNAWVTNGFNTFKLNSSDFDL